MTYIDMAWMSTNPWRRRLVVGAGVAVVYFGCRKLGLLLVIGGGVTPLSPSFGVAWALLLVLGTEYWPAILLGGFLSSLTAGFPWLMAAGLAVVSVLKVIAAVRLFSWFSRFRSQLGYLETLVAGLPTPLLPPTPHPPLTFPFHHSLTTPP